MVYGLQFTVVEYARSPVCSWFTVYSFLRSVGAQASELGVPFTVYRLKYTDYGIRI